MKGTKGSGIFTCTGKTVVPKTGHKARNKKPNNTLKTVGVAGLGLLKPHVGKCLRVRFWDKNPMKVNAGFFALLKHLSPFVLDGDRQPTTWRSDPVVRYGMDGEWRPGDPWIGDLPWSNTSHRSGRKVRCLMKENNWM